MNGKDSNCCDIRNKPKVRIQDFEDAYKANRRLRQIREISTILTCFHSSRDAQICQKDLLDAPRNTDAMSIHLTREEMRTLYDLPGDQESHLSRNETRQSHRSEFQDKICDDYFL